MTNRTGSSVQSFVLVQVLKAQHKSWWVIILFTDNILMSKAICSHSDIADFQHDIDLVSYWAKANHLTLNSDKSKFMLISRSQIQSCPHSIWMELNLREYNNTNTLVFGFQTTFLGRSMLNTFVVKLVVTWDTYFEHFLLTVLPRPSFTSTGPRFFQYWTMAPSCGTPT